MRAHLGLGLALQCKGDADFLAQEYGSSSKDLEQAGEEAGAVLDHSTNIPEQQIAHAFFLSGLVHVSRSKLYLVRDELGPGFQELRDASTAFASCLARNDEDDKFLTRLNTNYCAPTSRSLTSS
jgi:hypothetical protein